MSNNDSGDPSVGGAVVGWTSGVVAGLHISAAVTAVTGGPGVVLAPLITGVCGGYGAWRGMSNRKSPTSPALTAIDGVATLIDGRNRR